MMNLIQALTEGTVEFKDNGVIIKHPPSSIMLQAARTIKQLDEINQTNAVAINSLTVQNQLLLQDLQTLRDAYDNLRNATRPVPEHTNDSVRTDAGEQGRPEIKEETSSVERSDGQPN